MAKNTGSEPQTTDATAVWAYGIATPGWYPAASVWNNRYATHLQEDLGYRVVRSIGKPLEDGTPTDFQGRPISA